MVASRRRYGTFFLVLFFSWFSFVLAQSNSSNETAYSSDPILKFRPPFARSLPVQILLTGVVLTLVCVLLCHLIFTAQYHWPLARVNYILQLSGAITLLISLIATLHVVFSSTIQESQHWPYMLSYIAVDMPNYTNNSTINPNDPTTLYATQWSVAERCAWLAMNASTSGLIQITHIQFLTLLFPSALEARLIFCLLGPLAVISAAMQLIPIYQDNTVVTMADDIRNVCNATLSLLFTISLIIWGALVNPKQAWRTDGGTAAFGAGAIILALISTALNFLYIPSQYQFVWLPKLMWAVVLWQSFLGWWWWVGAGMGVGELEELLRREEKREMKRKLRAQRRKEHRERAKVVWRGVTGAFKHHKPGDHSHSEDEGEGEGEGEGANVNDNPTGSGSGPSPSSTGRSQTRPSTSTTGAQNTTRANTPINQLMNTNAGQFVQRFYAHVRRAHLAAARRQAVERVELIQQVYGREEVRKSVRNSGGPGVVGWGLGSFAIREFERERRQSMALREESEVAEDVEDLDDAEDVEEDADQEVLKEDIITAKDEGIEMTPISKGGVDQKNDERPLEQPLSTPAPGQSSSMWWWGPLRQWRLKDSTAYR